MGRDLGAELLDVLDRWRDNHVAVRVVASTDELVAVFSGKLGSRSAAKGSSLFWPVELTPATTPELELPGMDAHRNFCRTSGSMPVDSSSSSRRPG